MPQAIVPIPERVCPACGHEALTIEWRYEAKPIGSFALSGAQFKVSAVLWPWIKCQNCGIEARGEYEAQPKENPDART